MPSKQEPKVPPAERVQDSYKRLTAAATNLNVASDELGKAIAVLEVALQRLNLGVSAWVRLSGWESENHFDWWSREVGYTKLRDKWGIALRKMSGNLNFPDDDSVEQWMFNEAPRWMRAEAVGKIPDLLEALLRQAQDTTKVIKDKTAQAFELAVAMSKVAEGAQPAEQKGGKAGE
jgi:hypothetical protein